MQLVLQKITTQHRLTNQDRAFKAFKKFNVNIKQISKADACSVRQQTDGADDAGVAGGGGLRVDVQQAHVLQEGVGHGSVQLLRLDEGRAQVLSLGVRHGESRVAW